MVACWFIASLSAIAADPSFKSTIHTGHYEKKSSGLSGDNSYLVFENFQAFEKVLGTTPSIGPRKSNPVTEGTFQNHEVVVVIKRGKAVAIFTEVSATVDNSVLTLSFKADAGTPGTAIFASSLVVAVPKGLASRVRYLDGGREVSK